MSPLLAIEGACYAPRLVDWRVPLWLDSSPLAGPTRVLLSESVAEPTEFQIACMTPPFAEFPLRRAMGGRRKLWIERFKKLGPIARDHGVILVVKQHGGATGTGKACAEIVREVDDAGIKVNYDAGNVMDYLNLDPIPDIGECADVVHSFCMKDHRNWPLDQDCGPGFGEIDHYRLLHPVAFAGRVIPLCCENVFAPVVPRPQSPEEVELLARQVREYLETVVAGIQMKVESPLGSEK